jgi:hypothetical protein
LYLTFMFLSGIIKLKTIIVFVRGDIEIGKKSNEDHVPKKDNS